MYRLQIAWSWLVKAFTVGLDLVFFFWHTVFRKRAGYVTYCSGSTDINKLACHSPYTLDNAYLTDDLVYSADEFANLDLVVKAENMVGK